MTAGSLAIGTLSILAVAGVLYFLLARGGHQDSSITPSEKMEEGGPQKSGPNVQAILKHQQRIVEELRKFEASKKGSAEASSISEESDQLRQRQGAVKSDAD
mmetsp:Transcript_3793/g.6885  ORF Transcript_3793/g.6885 Transcript_3793/m.6885 type:complete len:102 (+) Transcript_3793:2-307(+)